MIKIKRSHGGDFLLMKTVMRQRLEVGFGYRQARRSGIARVFRKTPLRQTEGCLMGCLAGKYQGDEYWEPSMWWMTVFPVNHTSFSGEMTIGCQRFSPEETAKIRKWALKQPKRRKI